MTASSAPSVSAADRARVEEIERLDAAGPSAASALIEQLGDPSWGVRRAVVAALARIGEPAIGPMIASLASVRSSEARIAAIIDALSASSGSPEEALEALGDTDPSLTCDVAQILGRRRHPRSVAMLERWVAHADDNVAVCAMEALGRIGGAAGIDAIVSAASSRQFFRVFPAIDVLARSGDVRAVPTLTALLTDPVCSLEAARALGRAGDLSAAAPLVALLLSANEQLVRVAAIALAEIEDHQHLRFGATDTVLPTVRALGDPGAAARRVERCLEGAGTEERIALCRALGWLGAESAAATLVGLLGGELAVVRAAALALRRLGRVGDGQILAALRHGSSAQRQLLLPLVPLQFDATNDVAACLRDPDPAVRIRACEILGQIGDVSAVPALFARLADEDAQVTQSAMGAIHGLGSDETERRTLASARSPDSRVRRAGVRMIGYFGWPSGLDTLVTALSDDDERVRDSAIQSLSLIEDPRAVVALLALSRGENARARASAMRALGRAPSTPSTVEALLVGLKDEDPWARYYACQSLGRLGGAASVEAMLPLLEDPAGHVRVAAIEALALVADPRANEALVAAARSDDPDARRAALLGLGMSRSERGLAAILLAAVAPDVSTRLVALSAVSSYDNERAEQMLEDSARDSDTSVRAAAFGLLGARPGRAATARLIALLGDEAARDSALGALSQHTRGRIPGILAALEEADTSRAQALVAALSRMRRSDARAALGVALAMDRLAARRAAAAALAAVPSPDHAPAMERAAHNDPDPEVRRLATFALTRR